MRVVLISGGTRGIGKACVRAFCQNGDRVFFFYRSSPQAVVAELEQQTGAEGMCVDISDPDQVRSAVDRILQRTCGKLDVLVNNAGIAQIKLFTDLTDADWRQMMATNLDGAFHLCRAVAPAMIRNRFGRILNIGSMWGKCGASCEVHYSASKAGLRGLTMALAKELGPSGITVNGVEPGVIETDMNRSLTEQTRRELCEQTPLCRLGSPEEVASAVLFLASDSAGFITGQMLGVDGGIAIG